MPDPIVSPVTAIAPHAALRAHVNPGRPRPAGFPYPAAGAG